MQPSLTACAVLCCAVLCCAVTTREFSGAYLWLPFAFFALSLVKVRDKIEKRSEKTKAIEKFK